MPTFASFLLSAPFFASTPASTSWISLESLKSDKEVTNSLFKELETKQDLRFPNTRKSWAEGALLDRSDNSDVNIVKTSPEEAMLP